MTFLAISLLEAASSDVAYQWGALLVTQGAIIVGVILSYLGTRKGTGEATDAANRSAALSEPTGNGFAADVREGIESLSQAVLRIESKVDTHIQDHARAHLRERD